MRCQSHTPCPEELNINDHFVIQKCINKILKTQDAKSVNSYLVSPYLDKLSFGPYSKEEIDSAFQSFEIDFDEVILMDDASVGCQKRYYESLSSLSNTSGNAVVFSSTRLYGDLIQVKLTDYYGDISMSKIKNNAGLHTSQMYEYILKIKEDGNVDIILNSSTFYD